MTEVVIIEPHPDDALLSCSHVLASDASKLILSVGKNDSGGSGRLADFYPNIRTMNLGLPNIGWEHRCRPNEVKAASDAVACVRQRLHEYPHFRTIYQDMRAALMEYKSYPDVLIPVGIVHPYHVLVREIADEIFQQVSYYADKPYSEMGYGALIEKAYKMGTAVSYAPDSKKLEVFKKVYPTEQRIASLYRAELKSDERLYRRPRMDFGTED